MRVAIHLPRRIVANTQITLPVVVESEPGVRKDITADVISAKVKMPDGTIVDRNGVNRADQTVDSKDRGISDVVILKAENDTDGRAEAQVSVTESGEEVESLETYSFHVDAELAP